MFPVGNELSVDLRAEVLGAVVSAERGVRELVLLLSCRASVAVSLLKEMAEEGLVKFRYAKLRKCGRPKKVVVCTALGLEFLEAYRKVGLKPLRARRVDLERAERDALYVERLVSRGVDAFSLFMELNVVARNIEESSETAENVRKE